MTQWSETSKIAVSVHLQEKWFISRIQGTSHHSFLPHQDPHLITQVIKLLRGVHAPTPHPDHVQATADLTRFLYRLGVALVAMMSAMIMFAPAMQLMLAMRLSCHVGWADNISDVCHSKRCDRQTECYDEKRGQKNMLVIAAHLAFTETLFLAMFAYTCLPAGVCRQGQTDALLPLVARSMSVNNRILI